MKSLSQTLRMQKWYWKIALRSPSFPVAAFISSIVCCLIIRSHSTSTKDAISETGMMLCFFFIPLLLGGAILSNDINSRRVILWHSSGLTRTAFVYSRFLFLFTELYLCILIPFSAVFLISAGHQGNYDTVALTLLTFAIGLLQLSASLTLLSSWLPAYWNAILMLGISSVTFMLPFEFFRLIPRFLTASQWHLYRVMTMSPYLMAADASAQRRFIAHEIPISLLWSITALFLADLIYKRKQLASRSTD